jgi:hypothetical protein
MPKKLKLGLNDLKVQSFVTSLKNEEKSLVKGASDPLCSELDCETTPYGTCETYQTCPTDCNTCVTCNTCNTCQGYTCDWWLCPTYQDPACTEIGC